VPKSGGPVGPPKQVAALEEASAESIVDKVFNNNSRRIAFRPWRCMSIAKPSAHHRRSQLPAIPPEGLAQ
jgi:hypothetical protein